MSDDKRNVHQRLAAAMEKVTYIQKEYKPGMSYKIVSHDVVTAKVRPALLENGIVYYPVDLQHVNNGNRAEVVLKVRFANIDDPQDFFDVPSLGYGIDKQDKGPGKAISYAVKYALLKAMGLETGEDADHDDIDHVDREQEERERRQAQKASEDAAKAADARMAAQEYVHGVVARLQTSDGVGAATVLQDEQAKIARIQSGYPELFKRIETAARNAGAPMREVA